MGNIIELTKGKFDKIKSRKKKLGSGVDGTVYGVNSKEVGNIIELTKDEFDKIVRRKKEIGSGVDGKVYGVNSKEVYKIYHNTSDSIKIEEDGVLDAEEVNIRDPKELRHRGTRINNKPINYIDGDGVILNREDAILKAIEKQEKVKYTNLPQKLIKVDGRLVGCVYKRYNSVFGIYALSYFPLSKRKEVLKKLYLKLKELYENNIYPVTLAQKNDLLPFSKKESNVILDYNLEPQIIDLDGISTYYSDSFCRREYERSLSSFSILALEIISGIDFLDADTDEEMERYIQDLVKRGIPQKLAKEIYNENGFKDEDRIRQLLK